MKIEPIKESDVDEIYDICLKVTEFHTGEPTFWPKGALQKWVNSNSDVTLMCKDNNEIVAFGLVAVHTPTAKATLENLWVKEQYRRGGLARTLVDEILKQLEDMDVDSIVGLTQEDNEIIKSALKSFGFTQGKKFYWFERAI